MPSRITNSFGAYELVDDVDAGWQTCIRIAADDVVLDGGNHTIDGSAWDSGTIGYGVRNLDAATGNVTVRNLTVTDADHDGVHLRDATDVEVANVRAQGGSAGIALANGTDATVTGVDNGEAGITLEDAPGNRGTQAGRRLSSDT